MAKKKKNIHRFGHGKTAKAFGNTLKLKEVPDKAKLLISN